MIDYNVIQTILLSGVAVSVATQILKSKYIPVAFQKYPRTTAAVASLIASCWVVYEKLGSIDLSDWTRVVPLAISTLLVAAVTYNQILKPSERLY